MGVREQSPGTSKVFAGSAQDRLVNIFLRFPRRIEVTKSKKIVGAAISTVLLVGGLGATSASAASSKGGKAAAVSTTKKGTKAATNKGSKKGAKAATKKGSKKGTKAATKKGSKKGTKKA